MTDLQTVATAIRRAIVESRRGNSDGGAPSAIYRLSYLEASLEHLAQSCDEGDVDMIERRGRPVDDEQIAKTLELARRMIASRPDYDPPVVTPVANARELLAECCAGGECDPE